MHRRTPLARGAALVLGTALAVLSLGLSSIAVAQSAAKVYRVGVLVNRGSPSPQTESLRAGLAQLGYVEGRNVIYEIRAADGQLGRLPGFAAELVSQGVDVIVTYGGPPTEAARKATSSIPIVFTLVADPVAIGAAASLARPGGNLTGITTADPQLPALQMALLKDLMPGLARVAILTDADIPGADASGLAPIDRSNAAAARAIGLAPQVLQVRGPKPDFDTAFKAMAADGAQALVVLEVPAVFAIARTVADQATARRLPTMLWGGEAAAGAVLSYGTSLTATYPRMPVYVDQVLKGARPADTPIELLARHQLVINLKTAREMGLVVPADLLKRADRVVE